MSAPHLPPGSPTLEISDDLFEETHQDLRESQASGEAGGDSKGAVAIADPEAPARTSATTSRDRPRSGRRSSRKRDSADRSSDTTADDATADDATPERQVAATTATVSAQLPPVGARDDTVVTLPHWAGFVERLPREPYLTAIVVGAIVFTVVLGIVTANGLADAAEDRDAASAGLVSSLESTIDAQEQIRDLQAAASVLAADGTAVADQADAVVVSAEGLVELLGDVRETFDRRSPYSYNARLSAIDDEVGELNGAIDEFDEVLRDLAESLSERAGEGTATDIEQQLLAALESLEVRVDVVLEQIG